MFAVVFVRQLNGIPTSARAPFPKKEEAEHYLKVNGFEVYNSAMDCYSNRRCYAYIIPFEKVNKLVDINCYKKKSSKKRELEKFVGKSVTIVFAGGPVEHLKIEKVTDKSVKFDGSACLLECSLNAIISIEEE
jgi:hypothetical protein